MEMSVMMLQRVLEGSTELKNQGRCRIPCRLMSQMRDAVGADAVADETDGDVADVVVVAAEVAVGWECIEG